jgi:hypothetical protein
VQVTKRIGKIGNAKNENNRRETGDISLPPI